MRNLGEVYFSVDVEADGSHPGAYSLSSLGVSLCAIRHASGEVITLNIDDPLNQWYSELQPTSEEFDPVASAVSGLDRTALKDSGRDPKEALADFSGWVEKSVKKLLPGGRAVFVAWPLSYDWMWVYWYMMEHIKESPFGHSSAIDMKSWYAGKTDQALPSKTQVYERLGVKPRAHTHNALDDAKEQGELWQHLLTWKP